MKSFTIHKLEGETYTRIEELAQREGTSINKTAKKLLRKALGIENESVAERRKRFERFFGTWTEEQAAEFEEAVRVFDEIDEESWR